MMGKLKQLHIDCTESECVVNQPRTCYQLKKTFKIAYEGYQVVEVQADTAEEAEAKFWDEGLNDLYNANICEIVPSYEAFEAYTDLND